MMKTIKSITYDSINSHSELLNSILAEYNIEIHFAREHLSTRLKERGLDLITFNNAMKSFERNNLCEFVYNAKREYTDRPFKMEVHFKDIILCLARRDDYLWTLNTVLDPKIHSKYVKPGKFLVRITGNY